MDFGNVKCVQRLNKYLYRLLDEFGDEEENMSFEMSGYSCLSIEVLSTEKCQVYISDMSKKVRLVESKPFHYPFDLDSQCMDLLDELLIEFDSIQDTRNIRVCPCCRVRCVFEVGYNYCDDCEDKKSYHPDVCPICIDPDVNFGIWTSLPCKHVFHFECLAKIKREDSQPFRCSVCRTDYHSVFGVKIF